MSFVKDTVNRIICRYGTKDPFEIAQILKISIFEIMLPSSVNGFFQKQNDKSIIFLNCSLNQKQKKFVLAHELGHFFMHNSFNSMFLSASTNFCINKFEKEADCFAARLITEDAEALFEKYGLTTRKQIADFYGINETIINMIYETK